MAELKEVRRLLRAEEAVNANLSLIQDKAIRELGLAPRRPENTVVVHGAAPARTAPATPESDPELVVARAGSSAMTGGSR